MQLGETKTLFTVYGQIDPALGPGPMIQGPRISQIYMNIEKKIL